MNLVYNIQSHDEIYVGKINIVGNTKTRDKIIRRELRVYPGEKYDGQKLKKSKERIYNLGYFEDVYFETTPSGQKDVKDLSISVKETKTGEFSFGGGYSSIDAWIGFVQVRQKNFDILDFPTFTGGGQDLVIRAELGTSRANYLVGWTDPWIFDYPLLFGFDVYRQEQNRSGMSGYGYDERRTGGDLKLGKEITDDLTTGLVYNLEEVKISNIPDNATEDLRREEGTNWISRLTWNTALDKRDSKYSPTKGYYFRLSLENAGGFLAGDKDFLKGWTTTSFYYSILDKLVLELKGRTGLAEAYGDSDEVPIYERFFAGGAQTIRGYKERAVGPRDRGTNAALGGEAMVIGNAEVNFPIFQKIVKGAVFYDIGNVWEEYNDVFNTSGYKQGVGAGVRVKTPIGPLKLDWGYPLNKNHDDKREGRFYFSVSHGF
jgi:outer membrane protein insertion porin family